jgi:Zn ribbon nucleic-acid-binding protein
MIKKINNSRLKNSKFLIVPEPLENEVFTSWLVRTAYAHKTHPHTFVNLFLGENHKSFFHRDIDASISESLINNIKNKTYNKKDIYSLTLKTYSGYLQEEIIDNGYNKFLTSLRFCPTCLREDKIPYFRKSWRVIFSTACLTHNCFLHDCCPKCSCKLDISRMYENKYKYVFCYRCGFDLRKTRKKAIPKEFSYAKEQIKSIQNTLDCGYCILENNVIYSFSFFEVIAQLTKLILVHNSINIVDKNKLSKILKYIDSRKFTSSNSAYTQISIKEQFGIFCLVVCLFENYPREITKFVNTNKLTYWKTLKDMHYVCFWFDNLVNSISNRVIHCANRITEEEILSAMNYLKKRGFIINKINLTNLMGCNFFSSYNKLDIKMKKLIQEEKFL